MYLKNVKRLDFCLFVYSIFWISYICSILFIIVNEIGFKNNNSESFKCVKLFFVNLFKICYKLIFFLYIFYWEIKSDIFIVIRNLISFK